ncbi:MAG TPA: glycosyltransferase family 2 protein [Candidatus Bathyarchaeia archaeon]|nr:glycosyltransferase family 2 protein [Candidatus Bathyarchaeia archaeon]
MTTDYNNSPPRYVSIIIVNGNKGWLSRCIQSITATLYPCSKFEVIVVDNASGDDLESIEKTFAGVRIVKLGKNVGYPKAVNIGAECCKGEYIAVLNNDVIVSPNWLRDLAGILERDESVGAVCPRKISLLMNEVLDGCGGTINILGQGWDRGESEIDIGQYSDLAEVTHPSGAIFLTRKKIMDIFGFLLNPDFFILMEDVDFGLRCWKYGYRVLYDPNCSVYHARSPMLGGLNEHNLYLYTKNTLAMIFEIFDLPTFIRLFPIMIETQFAQALYLLSFHKKSHAVPSVLRGVKDFLFDLRVYSGRRVGAAKKKDKEILNKFSQSLVIYEEAKRYEKLIKLFLSINNLYIKLVLNAEPIKDIRYFRTSPR